MSTPVPRPCLFPWPQGRDAESPGDAADVWLVGSHVLPLSVRDVPAGHSTSVPRPFPVNSPRSWVPITKAITSLGARQQCMKRITRNCVTGLVKQDRTRAAVVLVTTWAWLGSVRASVRGAVSGHGAGRDDEQWELHARGVSGGETGGLRHFRGCGVVVGGACHGFRVSQRHACAATATGSVLVGHGCAPCRLVAPGGRHLRPSVYFPGHFSKSQCRAGVRAGCPTFGAVLVSVSKMVRQ